MNELMVIVRLCLLLLLLCGRKLTTFSKDNIWYGYDVSSKSRQVLILGYILLISKELSFQRVLSKYVNHVPSLFWLLFNTLVHVIKNQCICKPLRGFIDYKDVFTHLILPPVGESFC